MKRIYLDYAAGTPVLPEVKTAMEEFYTSNFGNASGLYKEGREAKKALNDARARIAKVLSVKPHEIIFTSGGTEANNLAIFGSVKKGGHIITSAFEHKSVLEPIKELEKKGFDVTYLSVSKDGFIDPEEVKKALRPETVLVSLMYVNNEIGTIQPIREISRIVKSFNEKIIFHSDMCQAANYLDLNMEKFGVDLVSFSGAKVYGPKGVGFLYKKNSVHIEPIIFGGGQEMGFRSGTESVGLIVGMAKALEISQARKKEEGERLLILRDYFAEGINKIIGAEINGSIKDRIPSNLSVSFLGIESERLIISLDEKGIAVSSGSACDPPRRQAGSKIPELPHVIMSLGKGEELARGVIRFSLGLDTTKEDIDYVLKQINICIYEQRN